MEKPERTPAGDQQDQGWQPPGVDVDDQRSEDGGVGDAPVAQHLGQGVVVQIQQVAEGTEPERSTEPPGLATTSKLALRE